MMSVQDLYALCQQKLLESHRRLNDKGPNAHLLNPSKGEIHVHLHDEHTFFVLLDKHKFWVTPDDSGPSDFYHKQKKGDAPIAKALDVLRGAIPLPDGNRMYAYGSDSKGPLGLIYSRFGKPPACTRSFDFYLRVDQKSMPFVTGPAGSRQLDPAAWWKASGKITDISDDLGRGGYIWKLVQKTGLIIVERSQSLYLQYDPNGRPTYEEAVAAPKGRDLKTRHFE